MNEFLKKEPDSFIVKNELEGESEIYLENDCRTNYFMHVNDTKSSYMHCEKHMKSKLETEDSNQKNQIMCQSICIFCKNQYNAAMNRNMIFKSRINDSECILPRHFICGQLNNCVDIAEFMKKTNQIQTPPPKLNFETSVYKSFWNVKHIENLDLSIILADNVARSIYYRGLLDGYKMYYENEFKSNEKLSNESTFQNQNKKSYKLNNFTNELKQNIANDVPVTHLIMKSPSQIKSSEINDQKLYSSTLNDSCQPQFSLGNDIDMSHLPIPALQLMIGSELSNTKCKSDDDFYKNNNNNNVLPNKKPIKRRKNQLSTSSKLIESDHAKFSDILPIIPVSVIRYLDEP